MKRRAAWIATWVALGLVLGAGRAEALTIVFNGPGGFGISAGSAEDAVDEGVPVISVASIATAASLRLAIPAPDVLSFNLTGSPSVSNPNRATSEWNVRNGGTSDLSDAWLVFLNPVTYTRSQVGFEIDGDAGWALISIAVAGTDYYYPARFLGDLDAANTVDFLMRHRVGQALHSQGGELVLPQYSVGALQGIPVPEPGAIALGAVCAAVAAFLRRRTA